MSGLTRPTDSVSDSTQHIDDLGVPANYAHEIFTMIDQVAVVIGGAGGLGSAITRGYHQAGAVVVIADHNSQRANELAAELGPRAIADAVDTTDRSSLESLLDNVVRAHGKVDILCNTAGIASRHPAENFPEDEWDRIMNVNVKGSFLACQVFGRHMLARNSGSIINLASIASSVGYPHSSAYLQSKGAVAQMTRSLAIEWIARGVRVNAIAPSIFETELTRRADTNDTTTNSWVDGRTPIGRRGLPREIVGPAIFLATEASSMVTGHILAVDGGYTAS
ncbi:SDR family NAD(P)-dependent oxidoreductase [Rhodococcus sp. WY5]|jgi:NAD(P)-dependent dehydrogenase (short-subunit alcohol dehydrogenase family)|uniref:SDR family NAD(P)-dependent oxidoreductase n=1 Tax=Rhodococcus sp. WY5 TaxID=2708349 RepID=UPI001BDF4911|nr:SDR family oxidoreductase [Rhodococcus sp. WY5]